MKTRKLYLEHSLFSNLVLASSKQAGDNDIFNSENFINKLAVVEGVQSNFKTNWSLATQISQAMIKQSRH